MYKDQLKGKKEENENTWYTVLNEIKENDVPKVPENQEQQYIIQTPASVRSHTRLIRPTERESHSLYYLFMIDSCEPECYEEAMQV